MLSSLIIQYIIFRLNYRISYNFFGKLCLTKLSEFLIYVFWFHQKVCADVLTKFKQFFLLTLIFIQLYVYYILSIMYCIGISLILTFKLSSRIQILLKRFALVQLKSSDPNLLNCFLTILSIMISVFRNGSATSSVLRWRGYTKYVRVMSMNVTCIAYLCRLERKTKLYSISLPSRPRIACLCSESQ